jgi:two-component system OmpR family response regulator/two-component system response regulator RstA
VLLARINALLRRSSAPAAVDLKPLHFGTLTINPAARAATLNEQPLGLSSHEFELLHVLASHAGEVQSRETLYLRLYKREYDGMDRTLDVRVSHLRRKLGDHAENSERIKTVWGHGYLFVPSAW